MTTNFTLHGLVLPGLGVGKTTGAPTANLDILLAKNHHLPRGLYLCQVEWNNQKYAGLLYFGHNSLSHADCLEVHLLHFSGDLYGTTITVTTTQFLRDEIIFATAIELSAQIKKDLALADQLLKK